MRLAQFFFARLWSLLLVLGIVFIEKSLADDPQPVSITFGPDFFGYDGQWSMAQIRVGNPEQYLSVYPSTTNSETWVVGPAGCDGTSTCSSLRGGLFAADQSTSWEALGLYELGYSDLSQTTDNGYYGFDNISISDTISAPSQIVAVVNDTDHWIGRLGLVVQDTRFQNNTDYLPFVSTLVQNKSIIPSHSYGYTAGAYYKGRSVSGSLTLGGVDTSRYIANDLWFTLGQGYIPSIAVNSIVVSASASSQSSHWTKNPLTLLPGSEAAIFTIDSDTPFLWLPESVCDTVAQALNLTWNETIEVYTFADNSSPQSLVDLGLQFTFSLANTIGSSQVLDLNITYDAFNLQLSYPFPGLFTSYSNAKVDYFPMRRTNSSSQYTIGRAFLQEVYLTVDYERNLFALSQARFPDSSQQTALAAISRPKNSTWPGPRGSSSSMGLTTGAKAGIAVGIVVLAIAAAVLLWCFCFRKTRGHQKLTDTEKGQQLGLFSIFSRKCKSSFSTSAAELQADKKHPVEMVSNSRYELSAVAPVEMAAAAVSPGYFQERVGTRIPQRNDPRTPVELVQPQHRASISKSIIERVVERYEPPAPSYSPTGAGQPSNNSISPYSPHVGSNPFRDSSGHAISPVTGSGSDPDQLGSVNHTGNDSGSSTSSSQISPIKARSYGDESPLSSNTPSSRPEKLTSRNSTTHTTTMSLSNNINGPVGSLNKDSRPRGDSPEGQKFQKETARSLHNSHGQNTALESRCRFSWEA